MACYHPLKGFPVGVNPSGKTAYRITSYKVDHVELTSHGTWVDACEYQRGKYAKRVVREFVDIPCGKCIGCRLDYSRAWADRCMLELQQHEESWFLTLTYDDEHLSVSEKTDPESGEIKEYASLERRDIQLFMKRLRKALPKDHPHIKYFCAGEYGPKTRRPHYHMIIFGLHIPDLEIYKRVSGPGSASGYFYYNSLWLSNIWKNGHVVIGEVNWDTCAYTARYILKKQYGDIAHALYDEYGILPEFTTMSLRPAIGREFYDQNKTRLYAMDHISISTPEGGRQVRPSRYFDKLFDIDDPEQYKRIKEKRRAASEDARALKLAQTSKDFLGALESEEVRKQNAVKSLRRNLL